MVKQLLREIKAVQVRRLAAKDLLDLIEIADVIGSKTPSVAVRAVDDKRRPLPAEDFGQIKAEAKIKVIAVCRPVVASADRIAAHVGFIAAEKGDAKVLQP